MLKIKNVFLIVGIFCLTLFHIQPSVATAAECFQDVQEMKDQIRKDKSISAPSCSTLGIKAITELYVPGSYLCTGSRKESTCCASCFAEGYGWKNCY